MRPFHIEIWMNLKNASKIFEIFSCFDRSLEFVKNAPWGDIVRFYFIFHFHYLHISSFDASAVVTVDMDIIGCGTPNI